MYAELHALSNFSFLRGASHAEELAKRAAELGYAALAVTDECSLAGIVRAHQAAELYGIPLIVGAEFHLVDGPSFVLLAPDRSAYTQISRLITIGRRAAVKGRYRLTRADCGELSRCLALWLAEPGDDPQAGRWLAERVQQLWLAVHLLRGPDDALRLAGLSDLAHRTGLSCVATGGVCFHAPQRKALHDVMTAIRLGRTVMDCGTELLPNAERHLRDTAVLQQLYPPELLEESLRIAARCRFSMKELRYQYPQELVPGGHTPTSWLRKLTEDGKRRRWPGGVDPKVEAQIEAELALIAEMGYEPFFLTVWDIVNFANERGILCQGRGSAANSAVCYAIGVTAVDPARANLLFERFVSKERAEPPDIDVDFEHQRREEVIQYVFGKYGRERAALAATVISYRTRSAVRDVGKALGIEAEDIDRVTKSLAWWDNSVEFEERLRAQGFDPASPRIQLWLALTQTLVGFPRHLSQHVGGFVISDQPLHELVPVENASMKDRTVIQWDKDDLQALGLLKVDVLALGMLSAIRRSLELDNAFRGGDLTLATIPPKDAPTFAMIQRAETIGVFQIESRAQQSMLPRLKPANFYDLVVEVAIVRPGPIVGGMVHPFLKARMERERARLEGREPPAPNYPPQLHKVLGRTLGVPIFQEQVMEIAIQAAGFTPGEADQMRRSMAAWKRSGGLQKFRERLIGGMLENGYTIQYAEEIYERILGFGSYGFPESHSASFALLAYASSWLKCHRPAAFTCGLLNSQPMGFYPPAMLVREARRVGVEVRPVDVQASGWECSLERRVDSAEPALRLGLLQVSGLAEAAGRAIEAVRLQGGPFANVDDLARRAGLRRRELDLLADADALTAIAGHRHAARWATAGLCAATALALPAAAEPQLELRLPTEGEEVLADYRSTGLSLRQHPFALLRPRLERRRVTPNARLRDLADKTRVRVSGMVMFRQRPGSAKGVLFMTLEDETGVVNLIVRPQFVENNRDVVLGARLAIATGELQSVDGVIHVLVSRLADVSAWIAELPAMSRDFH